MNGLKLLTLMITTTLLCGGCVSRTVTKGSSYGEQTSETELVWIWQKEYRQDK